MGADIKALRQRIRSVDSTLHLTKAMGLVASSKIRRASDAMLKGRDYAAAVQAMIDQLCVCPDCRKSPYLQERGGARTKLIVIAGDRGLCGGYNANVFRLLREYPDVDVIPIGKRACERFGGTFYSSEHFQSMDGHAMAAQLCREFADGAFDRLGILSTKYVSMMTQEPQINWILPLSAHADVEPVSILFEPDEMQILNAAVPEYVAGMLMAAVRESFASEVAARRMAMDNAGKNAQEMISELQLSYNRARQSAITQEITEIVAGSGG